MSAPPDASRGRRNASSGAASQDEATPAMAQWFAAKAEYPDALIFFRMGDFYEMFFGDAETASGVLNIQLTRRGLHKGKPIPMCGVPLHAAEACLARLVRQGHRIAIVEQMEDADDRKGGRKTPLLRRVVRIITQGTVTEDGLLDPARPNWLVAVAPGFGAEAVGLARIDISAERFETECVAQAELADALARIDPVEIISPEELPLGPLQTRRAAAVPDYSLPPDSDQDLSPPEARAASAIIAYCRETHRSRNLVLPRVRSVSAEARLEIDPATRASLELVASRGGRPELTLFASVRRTLTAAGHRRLAQRLAAPAAALTEIHRRQALCLWLIQNSTFLTGLRTRFKTLPDAERALARLRFGRATPRDALAVLTVLREATDLPAIADPAQGTAPRILAELAEATARCAALMAYLGKVLAPDPPARIEDGGFVAPGFDAALDQLRALREGGKSAIIDLQRRLAEAHGIGNLRIRHHQQLGYVVEVPQAAAEALRALPGFTLRQSLADTARFLHDELSRLTDRITGAEEQARLLERRIWDATAQEILARAEDIEEISAALSELDVGQCAATLRERGTWCLPEITDGLDFFVQGGRHPVLETILAGQGPVIANDCSLGLGQRVLLLTGPNMSGKSTYLRQNALIVVLAQAGLPVPAKAAKLGVVDRLFCRVGTADDMASGRSTFLMEMAETATIFQRATPRSLIIIDELGRGTSTTDGLAIAWATLEAIHNLLRSRTIFATHFHELPRVLAELPALRLATTRTRTWRGKLIFLHDIGPGAATRSFGVEVARMAGLPEAVTSRAETLLATLDRELEALTGELALPLFTTPPSDATGPDQVGVPASLWELLSDLRPDEVSPKDALGLIYRIKALIDEDLVVSG